MSQLRIGRVDIRMRSGSTVKGHEPVYLGDPYSEIGRRADNKTQCKNNRPGSTYKVKPGRGSIRSDAFLISDQRSVISVGGAGQRGQRVPREQVRLVLERHSRMRCPR